MAVGLRAHLHAYFRLWKEISLEFVVWV